MYSNDYASLSQYAQKASATRRPNYSQVDLSDGLPEQRGRVYVALHTLVVDRLDNVAADEQSRHRRALVEAVHLRVHET
eukprot:4834027-Pleurochrysis_carterae.AAC.1